MIHQLETVYGHLDFGLCLSYSRFTGLTSTLNTQLENAHLLLLNLQVISEDKKLELVCREESLGDNVSP